MSTQFRQPMQPAQTGPGPQGGQPLHPTVSYGQPGGEPARVIGAVHPQYQQPQPQLGGYSAAGYDVSNLPPAPTPQYGVPVGQPVQPQGGYAPQGYAPAGYQPAPAQGGYQQPAAQPGYGYQASAPTGQPAGAPRQAPGVAYLDPEAILDGPAVPAELRGRKVSQAFGIYGALAKDWLNREDMRRTGGAVNVQGQPQGGQQPQGYQQPQQQPQGGYTPQAPGQQPARPQWADQIRDIVREVVDQRMAPVIQTTQRTALQDARETAARSIPDFQELEGDIMQMVAGANPQALADPGLWESAADLARGRRGRRTVQAAREQTQGQNAVRGQDGRLYSQLSTGQWVPLPPQMQQPQQPQQQNGYTQGQPVYGYAQPQPQAYTPGYGAVPAQQSVLPQYAFFAEGPNAPSMQQGTLGLISPRERGYAQKMNMSDEDYIAWRGGVVR